MHGAHVVTETAHKLKLLRIRPIAGHEDGFSAFLGDLRHTLHLKSVEEVETRLTAYEDGIQMQARLRPSGAQIWHTYAGPTRAPTRPIRPVQPKLPTAATFKRAPKGCCYICINDTPSKSLPHHMSECRKAEQPIGKRVKQLMEEYRAKNPKPQAPAQPVKTNGKRGADF
jgi:hypothetical protein